jgi:hypothetical protein
MRLYTVATIRLCSITVYGLTGTLLGVALTSTWPVSWLGVPDRKFAKTGQR